MKLVKSLAVVFLGALCVTGCTATDDTSTDGGTNDAAVDTNPVLDTNGILDTTPVLDTSADVGDPCTTCSAAHCTTEIGACEAETSCKSALDCFEACSTTDCRDACATNSKNPDGTSGNNKFADLETCVVSNCRTECGL